MSGNVYRMQANTKHYLFVGNVLISKDGTRYIVTKSHVFDPKEENNAGRVKTSTSTSTTYISNQITTIEQNAEEQLPFGEELRPGDAVLHLANGMYTNYNVTERQLLMTDSQDKYSGSPTMHF